MRTVLMAIWNTFSEMSFYLLFGFAVAGLLARFLSSDTVRRHLGRGRFGPILKASLFGIPLPLCSCGVIPVAMSLRKHGATKGATTAFLISTPQTGVDSMLVTYSLLGWIMAVFRPLAALVSGLIGGALVSWLVPEDSAGLGKDEDQPAPLKKSWKEAFRHAFVTLPGDIAWPLLIGLVVSGLISAFVPKDFLGGDFGSGFQAKLLMMLIGIPLYVCATASVPIAWALMSMGVSPGAALIFLMTGPATNAATFTTIGKVMGWRAVVLYLMSVMITAIGAGVALDWIFTWPGASAMHHAHSMVAPWVKYLSAVSLLAVLLHAKWRRR